MGLDMRADICGIDGVKDAFERGRDKLTPNAMQRVAENLRHLLLKSESRALARPRLSGPSGIGSDDGHFTNLNS